MTKLYNTWYHEVDGWLIHYCEMCNAEIAGRSEYELDQALQKHRLYVACRGC